MTSQEELTCRTLAASSTVGGPIRAMLEELDELRAAVKPFAQLVVNTSGRIPIERLSFADWHRLTKAAKIGGYTE